ncbi:hypothetical protein [Streptomyces scabiei]|uniref:hypothetical protein n=1 Tax=Streptomyces scabiei TaxID=1930 RepID=UPI000765F8F0|nr:hypothetical protein [Streptomyces scabiei]
MPFRTRDYTATVTNPDTGETSQIEGTHTINAFNPPREDARAIRADLAKEGVQASSVQVGPAKIS